MDRSKQNTVLSPTELDQLMTALRDLDSTLAHLRTLLQRSVQAQAEPETEDPDAEPPLPQTVLH
jgi:hypothetical protein